MASARSFFQTDCESIENPLISLSRNYGNGESRLTSSINESQIIQNLIPGTSAADLVIPNSLFLISCLDD